MGYRKPFFSLTGSIVSFCQLAINLAYSFCLQFGPYYFNFSLLLVSFLLKAAINIPETRVLDLLCPEQSLHFVDFVLLLKADFFKRLRQLEYALGKLRARTMHFLLVSIEIIDVWRAVWRRLWLVLAPATPTDEIILYLRIILVRLARLNPAPVLFSVGHVWLKCALRPLFGGGRTPIIIQNKIHQQTHPLL